MKSSFKVQVGGDHYSKSKHQPLEQVLDDMGYEAFRGACICKVLKYIKRDKPGADKIQDYEKAKHVLTMLIEETK